MWLAESVDATIQAESPKELTERVQQAIVGSALIEANLEATKHTLEQELKRKLAVSDLVDNVKERLKSSRSIELMDTICDLAKVCNEWDAWLSAFKDDPEMLSRLYDHLRAQYDFPAGQGLK